MARIEGIAAKPKEWRWSYSKLKNFETCAKRHNEIDLLKNYTEQDDDPNSPLNWGNAVHSGLAKACSGSSPLPETMKQFQTWVDRVRAGPGALHVEQKYAITRDFRPTTFFGRDAWYSGIGDIVRIDRDIALILDWKTGKILEDSVQLMLMATCLFVHFPALKRVRSEFVWLKDECTTPEVFTRQEVADQWVELLPRVKAMEDAMKSQTYPPKPSGLCVKYCPVLSCPFHGKGARR